MDKPPSFPEVHTDPGPGGEMEVIPSTDLLSRQSAYLRYLVVVFSTMDQGFDVLAGHSVIR
jgi:hypothetical protein